jgi:hypothetical protein
MKNLKNRLILFVSAVIILSAFAFAQSSVTIDFEAPTYQAGPSVVGQDGWLLNNYIPGANLSDAWILGPEGGVISGLQSLAAGNNFARVDVSKLDIFTAGADGTSAADVNLKYLQRTTAKGGQNGLFTANDPYNGWSPVWVRIEGNNITAVSDSGFVTIGSYTTGDVVEFSIDIDLDTEIYDVSIRNVTLGETEFTLLTPTPIQTKTPINSGLLGVGISGENGIGIFDDIRIEQIDN